MLEHLMARLGYHFKNPSLLTLALTHRSKSSEHNERLEFLGDAVVNCVAGDALFHRFPEATEGELSRWRSTLVNREALAELASDFHLSEHLILGSGEIKSGGLQRRSISSCAMEAVIGAIYLDSDFDTVKACLLKWYESYIDDLFSARNHKDPKTRLQEYAQAQKTGLPIYTVESVEGEAHEHLFTVLCECDGKKAYGKGSSRRRAEQDAASQLLNEIK